MEEQNKEKPQKTKIKQRVVVVLCAVILIQVLALGVIYRQEIQNYFFYKAVNADIREEDGYFKIK